MRFYSKPIPEHDEVPMADDGLWEELVDSWTERHEFSAQQDGVYVLSVGTERDPRVREAELNEILALVEAQGGYILGHEMYTLTRPRPRTLIGKGTSREVARRARECGASMIVLDAELTPSQLRNLEDEAGISVCDREAVILNVFLRNARTRRARIQVEIAQLEYLRPRIRGVGIDMDQQMGGVAGSRGPGETESELLARKLDGRLAELRKSSRKIQRADENRRSRRTDCRRIALVGYTNAGKTALMNALTEEELSSADRPFETLDTVSRSLSRHGENVVLSDTVGFIRSLPERLLESFESTLAELKESTLLAIVLDLSDYEWKAHLQTTLTMIEKLGAAHIPCCLVFNKVDLLDFTPDLEVLKQISGEHPVHLVSSLNSYSVARLRSGLLDLVRADQEERSLVVPYTASDVLSEAYARCRVLKSECLAEGLLLTIQGSSAVMARIEKSLKEVR